ncbi:hypothetical protein ACERII_12515 [Evansella sp. AB-rgal1]
MKYGNEDDVMSAKDTVYNETSLKRNDLNNKPNLKIKHIEDVYLEDEL